mmetsp:Transcript_53056/g.105488  ORF Transcript_53056/g.105488 Transcript_53056/m.105488 type:complete len:124 (+) Transcript_53056:138-509(+)
MTRGTRYLASSRLLCLPPLPLPPRESPGLSACLSCRHFLFTNLSLLAVHRHAARVGTSFGPPIAAHASLREEVSANHATVRQRAAPTLAPLVDVDEAAGECKGRGNGEGVAIEGDRGAVFVHG